MSSDAVTHSKYNFFLYIFIPQIGNACSLISISLEYFLEIIPIYKSNLFCILLHLEFKSFKTSVSYINLYFFSFQITRRSIMLVFYLPFLFYCTRKSVPSSLPIKPIIPFYLSYQKK